MLWVRIIVALAVALMLASAASGEGKMRNRQDIWIRDPFILWDEPSGRYYMYGTGTFDGQPGFDVCSTPDPTFSTWSEPKAAFRKTPDFWADRSYWAPEVHAYKGKYYMFATFEAPGHPRSVQILASDSPEGPFKVHSREPVTTPDFFALDGTLYVDRKGDPWLVYSREWVSVHDGQMRAVRLKGDLSGRLDGTEDILLFKASDAPWSAPWFTDGVRNHVTDGPEMLRTPDGTLYMLWSSNHIIPDPIHWGYAVGVAKSKSGEITGPWVQEKEPLYEGHAGHGMVFIDSKGRYILSVHQPNDGGAPHPLFIPIYQSRGRLTTADPSTPKSVIANWTFEDGTPGRGAIAGVDLLDTSGHSNHLRAINQEKAGRFSSATNSNESLVCYDNSEESKSEARGLVVCSGGLNNTELHAWTIECRVFLKRFGGSQAIVARESSLYLGINPNGRVEICCRGRDGEPVSVLSRTGLLEDRWYRVKAAYDGERLGLWIDPPGGSGYTAEGSKEVPGALSSSGVWSVGCAIDSTKQSAQFFGLIDQIRISSRAVR